jgi:glycosyltransferase involved in cell wall biosynthesis
VRRIVYDLTYAARGNSGIPRDTRSIAEILGRFENFEVDFVFSPKGFSPKRKIPRKEDPITQSFILNAIFQDTPNLFGNFLSIKSFRTLMQTLSPWPYLVLEKLTSDSARTLLEKLEFKNLNANNHMKFSIIGVSYAARFARPKILGRFKIKTKGADFYIQQHVDPIKVNSKTKHIVRLHDTLPISHPFFFSPQAQKAFSLGLSQLLKNQKILWVMDTEASKNDFLKNFGVHRQVEVIPCEIGSNFDLQKALKAVKNKKKAKNIYLCVNTIEPRKNVKMVIDSFLNSLDTSQKNIEDELIIAGKYGWMEEDLIKRLRSGYYGKQIIFIENANETQIQNLYGNADFVISASQAEGFGLPPLEGMLFGCLPIVSNIPQHRETMREKAIYFDVNEEALSDAIRYSRKMTPARRSKLGLEAHRYIIKHYSAKNLAQKWSKLLDDQLTK